MTEITHKTPLRDRTALSHLRAVERAKEIVSSWPEWKQAFALFRDRSGSATTSQADVSVEATAQKHAA